MIGSTLQWLIWLQWPCCVSERRELLEGPSKWILALSWCSMQLTSNLAQDAVSGFAAKEHCYGLTLREAFLPMCKLKLSLLPPHASPGVLPSQSRLPGLGWGSSWSCCVRILKLQSQFSVCRGLSHEPLTLCVTLSSNIGFRADHFLTNDKSLELWARQIWGWILTLCDLITWVSISSTVNGNKRMNIKIGVGLGEVAHQQGLPGMLRGRWPWLHHHYKKKMRSNQGDMLTRCCVAIQNELWDKTKGY